MKKLNNAKNAVTALQAVPNKVGGLPQTPEKQIDYGRDFFGSPTFLTVSGQLQAEILASSMVKSIFPFLKKQKINYSM